MSALLPVPKDQIEAFRREFFQELPSLAREYIDTARSEGTTQAYEKVMNTAFKAIEGLEVERKKDVYANLPVIHVSFGAGVQMTQVVEPPTPAADVTDAEPRPVKSPFASSAAKAWDELPDNPTDLLPSTLSPEEQATLQALNLAGSAMALED